MLKQTLVDKGAKWRSDRTRKGWAKIPKEDRTKRGGQNWKGLSFEERCKINKIRMAKLTPAQKKARVEKAWNNLTDAQRKERAKNAANSPGRIRFRLPSLNRKIEVAQRQFERISLDYDELMSAHRQLLVKVTQKFQLIPIKQKNLNQKEHY